MIDGNDIMAEPTAQEHFDDLSELICERFNPPDDDSYNEWTVIEAAADFIESLPCDCPARSGRGHLLMSPDEADELADALKAAAAWARAQNVFDAPEVSHV